MCLIIADNLNVHSLSLKPVIFYIYKKTFLSKISLFNKIFFTPIKDNVIQNMLKQKILIKFNYIFCFLICQYLY
jgi:hypothetical protein